MCSLLNKHTVHVIILRLRFRYRKRATLYRIATLWCLWSEIYVGETGRQITRRISEHRSALKKQKTDLNIMQTCSPSSNTFSFNLCNILVQIRKCILNGNEEKKNTDLIDMLLVTVISYNCFQATSTDTIHVMNVVTRSNTQLAITACCTLSNPRNKILVFP